MLNWRLAWISPNIKGGLVALEPDDDITKKRWSGFQLPLRSFLSANCKMVEAVKFHAAISNSALRMIARDKFFLI